MLSADCVRPTRGGLAQHAGLGNGDEAAQQVDVQRLAHGMNSPDS
jgi:hypothetical protein